MLVAVTSASATSATVTFAAAHTAGAAGVGDIAVFSIRIVTFIIHFGHFLVYKERIGIISCLTFSKFPTFPKTNKIIL